LLYFCFCHRFSPLSKLRFWENLQWIYKNTECLNSKKENKVLSVDCFLEKVRVTLYSSRMWFCLIASSVYASLLHCWHNMLGSPSWLVSLLSYKTMKDLGCISMINYSISLDFGLLLRTQSILWPRLLHPMCSFLWCR
jgi:hypothetical protein